MVKYVLGHFMSDKCLDLGIVKKNILSFINISLLSYNQTHFAIWCLKYQRLSPPGCNDKEIKKVSLEWKLKRLLWKCKGIALKS